VKCCRRSCESNVSQSIGNAFNGGAAHCRPRTARRDCVTLRRTYKWICCELKALQSDSLSKCCILAVRLYRIPNDWIKLVRDHGHQSRISKKAALSKEACSDVLNREQRYEHARSHLYDCPRGVCDVCAVLRVLLRGGAGSLLLDVHVPAATLVRDKAEDGEDARDGCGDRDADDHREIQTVPIIIIIMSGLIAAARRVWWRQCGWRRGCIDEQGRRRQRRLQRRGAVVGEAEDERVAVEARAPRALAEDVAAERTVAGGVEWLRGVQSQLPAASLQAAVPPWRDAVG